MSILLILLFFISFINIFLFFGQMASKFSEISSEQVKAQKNRLIAARDLDESEKRMYIKVLTIH